MGSAILKIISMILAMLIIGVLLALPVMLLWNLVMPQLFGLNNITFLQALWLSLLCRFLFGFGSSNKEEE